MTANAIASVSLQPPLVLACIEQVARTHQLVLDSGIFAINILTEDQGRLAQLMAGEADEEGRRLRGISTTRAITGAPIITGSLAYLDCRVVAQHPAGDHTIFVAEVVAAGIATGQPLLHYRSRYWKLAETAG